MSAVRKGGVTQKVLTGRTAANLQNYRDETKEGEESYLFAATQHCSHDAYAQIEEWKAVREEHGTQSATRRVKAKYEEVDAETGLHGTGAPGTHVKEFTGGRWRKRPVRAGETPTHLRIEPKDFVVKESEAVHTIYAAGADMVNPDNPEDLERFWAAVNAERNENYSGLQESRWLERNGESGLVHVHVASNATIFQDFESDGVQYRAGQKMSGALTRVHNVRARFNSFLREHPEHEMEQALANVGSKKYSQAQVRSGQKDYWDQKRAVRAEVPAMESNHAKIRQLVDESLVADEVTDRDEFVSAMKDRGVKVTETGLRRGKATAKHDYGYKVAGMKSPVTGKTLGPNYRHAMIGTQLERKAAGEELVHEVRQSAGPDRLLPLERQPWTADDHDEFEQLRADVEELARPQREAQELQAEMEQSQAAADQHRADQQAKLEREDEERQRLTLERIAERKAKAAETGTEIDAEVAELQERFEKRGEAQQATVAEQPEVESTPVRVADDAELTDDGQTVDEVEAESEVATEDVAESESAEPAFRSGLRDVRSKDDDRQAKINAVVQLEEDYHGREPDAEFERRAAETRILGAKFLEKAGGKMSPDFREHVEARVAQAAERRAAYDERRVLRDRRDELKADRKSFDEKYDREVTQNRRDNNFYDKHIAGIDAARTEGDYSSRAHEVVDHADKEKARGDKAVLQRGAEINSKDPDYQDRQARIAESDKRLDRDMKAVAARDRSQSNDNDGLG